MPSLTLPDDCYDSSTDDVTISRRRLAHVVSNMMLSLRHQASLTQVELARLAGTSQPVIARIESGADMRLPSFYLLVRIASALKARLRLDFELKDHFN